MKNSIKALLVDENGQGVAEYSLLISLVILAAVVAVKTFGEELVVLYHAKIADNLP